MSTISADYASSSPVQSLKARIKALQTSFTAELKELEKQVALEFKGVKGRKAPKAEGAEKKPLTAWTAFAQHATSTWKAEFDEFRASQPKGKGGMPSFAKHCKEETHVADYEAFVAEYEEAHPKAEKPTKVAKAATTAKAAGDAGRKAKKETEAVDAVDEAALLSSSASSSAPPEASVVTKTAVKRSAKATKKPKEWKLGSSTYMKNADHQVWECSASGLGEWVGVYDTKEKKIDTGVDEPERPVMD
jgi:hypothetical protein